MESPSDFLDKVAGTAKGGLLGRAAEELVIARDSAIASAARAQAFREAEKACKDQQRWYRRNGVNYLAVRSEVTCRLADHFAQLAEREERGE